MTDLNKPTEYLNSLPPIYCDDFGLKGRGRNAQFTRLVVPLNKVHNTSLNLSRRQAAEVITVLSHWLANSGESK